MDDSVVFRYLEPLNEPRVVVEGEGTHLHSDRRRHIGGWQFLSKHITTTASITVGFESEQVRFTVAVFATHKYKKISRPKIRLTRREREVESTHISTGNYIVVTLVRLTARLRFGALAGCYSVGIQRYHPQYQ